MATYLSLPCRASLGKKKVSDLSRDTGECTLSITFCPQVPCPGLHANIWVEDGKHKLGMVLDATALLQFHKALGEAIDRQNQYDKGV